MNFAERLQEIGFADVCARHSLDGAAGAHQAGPRWEAAQPNRTEGRERHWGGSMRASLSRLACVVDMAAEI